MAVLFIHRNVIMDNLAQIREQTGSFVIPDLSGNAMGIGDFEVTRMLYGAGIRLFAVSRLEEAERIAAALPAEAEILLLSPYSTEAEAERIVNLSLTAAVGSYDSAVLLNGIAGKSGVKLKVHILFDTGLGHFGFLPEEADQAVQAVKYLTNLQVTGCFTELADRTGENKKRTLTQLAAFNACVGKLRRAEIDPGLTHIAQAEAAIHYAQLRLDAVRIGPELYGRTKKRMGLQKPYRLASQVSQVRWLPAKHYIGEGGSYRAKKPVKVAVIPIGCADGLFADIKKAGGLRGLFGKKEQPVCEIDGNRAPILGNAGACSVAVDVSTIECRPGDTVWFDVNPVLLNANIERRYI